jgi:hypothetical protein
MRPVIYEINTATFLYELSQQKGEQLTLADVPDEVWDGIAAMHINTIWLMGVWQRSPISVTLAEGQPWVEAALPAATDADVIGSAYSIRSYTVDQLFGGNNALAIARGELKKRGMNLWLDYVPNHVAIDNEWTIDHPEYFVAGTEQELRDNPSEFKRVGDHIFANGKDPHFEAWSDVLQLNVFEPALRAQTTNTLKTIATMCDGVRCDMAMLLMNDVFSKTWIGHVGETPIEDFWPQIIKDVKSHNPEFLFTAEVYWDREEALIEQGFDFCYDKELYDAVLKGSAKEVRHRLRHTAAFESKLLHFIENHDEPRAAVLPGHLHEAAAVIMATIPGAHLYHDGQWDGFTQRVPVQLRRRVAEQKIDAVHTFYEKLLAETTDLKGEWRQMDVHRSLFGGSAIFAWEWDNSVVFINFGHHKGTIVTSAHIADKPRFGSMKKSGKHVSLLPYEFAIVDKT